VTVTVVVAVSPPAVTVMVAAPAEAPVICAVAVLSASRLAIAASLVLHAKAASLDLDPVDGQGGRQGRRVAERQVDRRWRDGQLDHRVGVVAVAAAAGRQHRGQGHRRRTRAIHDPSLHPHAAGVLHAAAAVQHERRSRDATPRYGDAVSPARHLRPRRLGALTLLATAACLGRPPTRPPSEPLPPLFVATSPGPMPEIELEPASARALSDGVDSFGLVVAGAGSVVETCGCWEPCPPRAASPPSQSMPSRPRTIGDGFELAPGVPLAGPRPRFGAWGVPRRVPRPGIAL
jgi:hypothetical protein